jgi:hypothetical protein
MKAASIVLIAVMAIDGPSNTEMDSLFDGKL